MERSCRAPNGRGCGRVFPKIGNLRLPALLARAGRLGAQPLELALGHREADLADPVELDADDRLGVEAVEIDDGGGFTPLDRLQIAFAGLEPDLGLFEIVAGQRMALVLVD